MNELPLTIKSDHAVRAMVKTYLLLDGCKYKLTYLPGLVAKQTGIITYHLYSIENLGKPKMRLPNGMSMEFSGLGKVTITRKP